MSQHNLKRIRSEGSSLRAEEKKDLAVKTRWTRREIARPDACQLRKSKLTRW